MREDKITSVMKGMIQADEQNGGPPYEYIVMLGKHAIEIRRGQAIAAIEACDKADREAWSQPHIIAAAWRAFRGGRPGALLGPGAGFREALDAAIKAMQEGPTNG